MFLYLNKKLFKTKMSDVCCYLQCLRLSYGATESYQTSYRT